MFAASILSILPLVVAPIAPRQDPNAPPSQRPQEGRDPKQDAKDKSQDKDDALTELTRAEGKLITADSYRFRVQVQRHRTGGGNVQQLGFDGHYEAGKPLMMRCEQAELLAFRGPHRVFFRTEKGDDWDVLPLDAKLFGGEGKRRINQEERAPAKANPNDPNAPKPEQPKEPKPPKDSKEPKKPDEPKPDRPDQPKNPNPPNPEEPTPPRVPGSKTSDQGGHGDRDDSRLFDDVDPEANRLDRQALAFVAVVPAPHDLLRALLDGIVESKKQVDDGGFFKGEKIVWEARLNPDAEQLCREHFAKLLPKDQGSGPLDCRVRFASDKEGNLDAMDLEIRGGKDAKDMALRLAYEIDRIGDATVKVPEEVTRKMHQ